MKLKKLISLSSIATLVLFIAASCNNSKPDSATSKTYTVSDFSSLNVNVVGDVFYEQSDSFYVHVSGSSTLIEALKVSDSKGKLSIELKNKRSFNGDKKELEIRIGSPQLNAINFESVGTLHLKNHFEAEALNIINNGVGKIIIDDCNVSHFSLNSKSVGVIEIKGAANDTYINSEGVGKIDCSQFKSNDVTVISKGVGSISVYALKSIDISLKGIGNVNYYGNPTTVKTDISGLGKAIEMDTKE